MYLAPTGTERKILEPETVLIVDGNEHTRGGHARFLTTGGTVVHTARNIEEALMLLRQQPAVRLALVDHALPDGPGTELLAFIKTRYRQVRVVALVSSPRAAMEYKLLGALAVAQKPVTPHQVAQLLAAAREEKRDTRRFPLRVPVMVNGTMAAFSLNVSADGMLLETPDPLTTAEVSLTMLPENTAPACRFRARVVRSGRHQSLAYAAVQLTENIGQTLLEHLQGRAATAV